MIRAIDSNIFDIFTDHISGADRYFISEYFNNYYQDKYRQNAVPSEIITYNNMYTINSIYITGHNMKKVINFYPIYE